MNPHAVLYKMIALFVGVLVIGLIIFPLSGSGGPNQISFNSGNILYVGGDGPGNFTKIQDAIDNATKGDTVYVYNGTYYEKIEVYKSINLMGEDKNITVIDAGGISDAVEITADEVTISSFTIRNSGTEAYNAGVGIYSNSNNITDNKISDNKVGICLHSSHNNIITTSNITDNAYEGILLRYSCENVISDNLLFLNHGDGITLYSHSGNNTVSDNHILNNKKGIYLTTNNDNNTIANNTIKWNNFSGIDLSHFNDNNYLLDNTISYNDHQGISFYKSNDNTISDNKISHNQRGIDFVKSNNSDISRNDISYNYHGVLLFKSSNNFIFHNDFIENNENSYDDFSNTWDSGYPSGGNHWSDYNDVDDDGDGIGDTPYAIPGGDNQDRYPLMNPYEKDNISPGVEIFRPGKAIYIMDKEVTPFFIPVIIGKIQIWPHAIDNESGLNHLELYIDNELKADFSSVPRSWTWDERTPLKFKHTIRIVAFDNAGNNASDEIMVWKFF